MHDYTRACLETGYFPNDAAAPAVFGEIASILQCIEPQRDYPYGLCADVGRTVQELLSLGVKGRRIHVPHNPLKPIASKDIGLAA